MNAITLNITSTSFWDTIGQFDSLPSINGDTNNFLVKLINKYFSEFLSGINNENKNARIIRSCKGATDLTYICRKYLESEEKTIKFVTKYIHPALSANTRLCSAVFNRLGLQSPKIYVVDSNYTNFLPRGKIGAFMGVDKQKYGKHDFAFMNAFDGADIGGVINNLSFFHLKEKCVSSLLKTFGTVAVYDLILGNDDRFYRPSYELIDDPSAVEPFINNGNVILEIKLDCDFNYKLFNVFCIDNTSSNRLKSYLTKNKTLEFEECKQVYLNSFLKAFVYFKSNEDKFAEKIYAGIYSEAIKVFNALSEDEKNDFKEVPAFFEKNFAIGCLQEGIKLGYKELSNQKPQLCDFMKSCLETIKPAAEGELLCKKILELADLCLQSLDGENTL